VCRKSYSFVLERTSNKEIDVHLDISCMLKFQMKHVASGVSIEIQGSLGRCLFVYGCKGDIHWDTRERVKESLVSEVNAVCGWL